jgi:hypothetical protein
MFHKITLNGYPGTLDFTKGQGFYLVDYTNGHMSNIHYWNPSNVRWITLEIAQNFPKEFLDLFEETVPIAETGTGKVSLSEDFLLKLIAVSKVNSQTVKLNDILK